MTRKKTFSHKEKVIKKDRRHAVCTIDQFLVVRGGCPVHRINGRSPDLWIDTLDGRLPDQRISDIMARRYPNTVTRSYGIFTRFPFHPRRACPGDTVIRLSDYYFQIYITGIDMSIPSRDIAAKPAFVSSKIMIFPWRCLQWGDFGAIIIMFSVKHYLFLF